MAKRKTISVAKVLHMANSFMQKSADNQAAERTAIQHFAASILHDTGNYKGFGYLGTSYNEQTKTVHIPDESRAVLFVADGLKDEYRQIEAESAKNN